VLFPASIESNVVVTNMARVFAPPISETVMGILLSLTRGFNKYSLLSKLAG
jgi:lactate dehydrogenase-like 2-hydroxyacid dehydrogenase